MQVFAYIYSLIFPPAVTWAMIERNKRDEVQVSLMLNVAKAAIALSQTGAVRASMREEIRDLEDLHLCIRRDRFALSSRAVSEGLMLDWTKYEFVTGQGRFRYRELLF